METEQKRPVGPRRPVALLRLAAVVFGLTLAVGISEATLRLLGYGRSYFHAFSMFHENDDLVGIRGRPHFTGRLKNDEMDAIISNDERGFRKPAREIASSPERQNIFVLGDSFIWGWGVGQGKVITDRMQERLPDRRVQNFAVSATGTVQQFVIFEKYVLPELRQGDWVVLNFCGCNDFDDNLGRSHPGRLYATIANGEIRIIPPDGTSCPNAAMQRLRDASYLVNLLIYSWNRGSDFCWRAWHAQPEDDVSAKALPSVVIGDQPPFGDNTPEFLVAAHFLRAFQLACQQRGVGFVVVYVPRQEEFGELEEFKGAPFSTRERQTLLRCAASLGIEVIDLLPRFRTLKAETPQRRLTYYEGHWNAEGHRVAGESVCEFLAPRLTLHREKMAKEIHRQPRTFADLSSNIADRPIAPN